MGLAAPRHVGSSWIRDWTHVPLAGRFFTTKPPGKPLYIVAFTSSQVSLNSILATFWSRSNGKKKQSSSRQQPKCTLKNCHSGLVVPLLKTLNWTFHPLRRLQFLQRPMSSPWFCPGSFLTSSSAILFLCPALQPHGLPSPSCPPGVLPPHKRQVLFPLHDCFPTSLISSPHSGLLSNALSQSELSCYLIFKMTVPFSTLPILLSSFLNFVPLYHVFYLLIYFIYCASPELSPTPKR